MTQADAEYLEHAADELDVVIVDLAKLKMAMDVDPDKIRLIAASQNLTDHITDEELLKLLKANKRAEVYLFLSGAAAGSAVVFTVTQFLL